MGEEETNANELSVPNDVIIETPADTQIAENALEEVQTEEFTADGGLIIGEANNIEGSTVPSNVEEFPKLTDAEHVTSQKNANLESINNNKNDDDDLVDNQELEGSYHVEQETNGKQSEFISERKGSFEYLRLEESVERVNFMDFQKPIAEADESDSGSETSLKIDLKLLKNWQEDQVIESDLATWKNKPYLGGYRNKYLKKEYFHAFTQTTTAQEIKYMVLSMLTKSRKEHFHRDCQTVYEKNNRTQTLQENSTQMTKSGCYVTSTNDKVIKCKKYITADDLFKTKTESAITIQCFIRQIQARKRTRKLFMEKQEKTKAYQQKEQRRQALIEKQRILQNERRLHPKSGKDFEALYSGLENWRAQEALRINRLKLNEPARLAALADLLDQESCLIQKIDKLKIEANLENRERGITAMLQKISSPKKWIGRKNEVVLVDTPNIIRARELRDLYNALNYPLLTVDERLQILLHVKFTVKEFDCNLSREIVDLIDREGDLISRGRGEKTMLGLRQRISNLFLQFIKTPEFNPEMSNHVSQLNVDNQSWKDSSVYYCRGCTKYKASTEFYLSTTIKHLGKCKDCSLKENLAIQKTDDSSYANMLKLIRAQESIKRNSSGDKGHCNPMALLQESDLRYLVDIIWNRKSAITGNRQMDELILTRWDNTKELSPWNCILLTKSEALTHDCQKNSENIYSIDFRNKIFQKQLLARQHFGNLPSMAEYLRDNYEEKLDGKLVLRENQLIHT